MDKEKMIKNCVEAIIARLYGQLQYSPGKAKLAKLRNSIGRTDQVDAYSFVFELIPEDLLGRAGDFSDEEKAIICSLQLYALLQQGREECMHGKPEEYHNFGTSLSKLRIRGESEAVDRRFNAMILADTAEQFQIHLRYMIRLFKSNFKKESTDFAQLAADIYRFIHWEGGKEQVRLSWAREYYKSNIKGEDNYDK